jgi:hypothetical protein
VSKKDKVLEIMAKHPKWRISRVAKTAKCSESFAYLIRSQAKAEERHAALVELDAERRASTQAETSVLVPSTGVSAEVQTSYEIHNDIAPQPLATRGNLLDVAKTYITKDRQADHGDAEDNFSRIAQYWSVHLGTPVKAHDVAVMMALLKVARIKQNPHHIDNWVDGAGYFACGGEIANLQ